MASVVGTYARAFADVVMTKSNLLDPARMLQELHGIEALLKESDPLRRVLENPSIPGNSKRAVLDAITPRLGTTRQVRNFVAIITDNRRLPLFSEILKQVEQELDDRQGFAEAQVSSARQLNDPEKQMLEVEIAKMTGIGPRALRTGCLSTRRRRSASGQHHLRRLSKRPVRKNLGATGGGLTAASFEPRASSRPVRSEFVARSSKPAGTWQRVSRQQKN